MALTVTSRGTGTHNTGATTLVPGGRTGTLAVGSLGVFCIALDNAGSAGSATIAPASWTDAKGNVWTEQLDALYDNGAASAGIEMAVYTAPITVALLTTDAGTITWGGSTSPVAKAWTWYEVIPSNGITPAFLNAGSIAGATAANATVVTGESINVGDAVIAGYFSENVAAVTGDSDTTNGTWTAQQTATIGSTTSGVRIATQQKVQTTAASTQSYDVTVSSQDRIAGYISVREVQAIASAPTAASLTTTLGTPVVTVPLNVISEPTAASLTVTAGTPTVAATANVTSLPTAASLTATGATPTVAAPALSLPGSASMTATGAVPVVTAGAGTTSLPTAASLALTGATPAIVLPVSTLPAAGSLSLSVATPTVQATANQTVVPGPLGLVITTFAPTVLAGASVSAQPGSAALTLTAGTPIVTLALFQFVGGKPPKIFHVAPIR